MRWGRMVGLSLAAVVLAGCGGGDDSAPMGDAGMGDASVYEPPPQGCNVARLDFDAGEITRWPEPDLLTADPMTGTGQRLVMDPDRYAPTLDLAGIFKNVLTEDLSDPDGFGVNSQAFFRFSLPFDAAMVPSGEETASPDTGLGLVVLAPGGPYIEPYILRTTDGDATLMMAPMHPLPEQTRVVAFATKALAPAAGGCLWPSEDYFDTIHSADPDVSDAILPWYRSGSSPMPRTWWR